MNKAHAIYLLGMEVDFVSLGSTIADLLSATPTRPAPVVAAPRFSA